MKRHVAVGFIFACAALAVLSAPLFAANGGGGGAGRGVQIDFAVNSHPVTVTISGRITDANTGAAIGGARVHGHVFVWRNQGPELFDLAPHTEVFTDANGAYQILIVTPLTTSGAMKDKDNACIAASAPGYETKPFYLRPAVTADKTAFTGVDLALKPGRKLSGKVVDNRGQPIAGALIRARNNLNGDWNHFGCIGRTDSAADGSFEMWVTSETGQENTPRDLLIFKEGYGVAFVTELKDDLGAITVQPGAAISGTVVDADGKGLRDCEIVAVNRILNVIGRTRTDINGSYRLTGISGSPSIVDYFKKRGSSDKLFAQATIHARSKPEANLRDVPQYEIMPQDGKEVTGPELMVGAEVGVSGTLVPGKNSFGLQGLMVRLDYDWERMVEADSKGGFAFPNVAPGKHRLTAYLPTNLRGDRGIGSTEVDVQPKKPVTGVTLQLETLAEVRVHFVDVQGSPVEGITAGATWTKDGSGLWTEGTKSGLDGWAVLFMYPGDKQYVRGFDHGDKGLVSANVKEILPKAGEVTDNVEITMVAQPTITGRFVGPDGKPLADKALSVDLVYADGNQISRGTKTDAAGKFELKGMLSPGVVTIKAATNPLEYAGASASPVEVKPGEAKDVGRIFLQKVKLCKVAGRVVASKTITSLEGIQIRLDLTGPWQFVAKTDSEGRFEANVPEGKRRLTAYLPNNERFDAGAGHVVIDVKADVRNVALPLLSMARIHVKIVDESGSPVEGVSAGSWWNNKRTGPGMVSLAESDAQGSAVMYMYPGEEMYIGAFDREKAYDFVTPADYKPVKYTEGQVVENCVVKVKKMAE